MMYIRNVQCDSTESNKDKPFFLYLAHSMPHVPLHVSDKFKGKSKQGLYGDVIMEIDWSVGEILATLKKCNVDDNTAVIPHQRQRSFLSSSNHVISWPRNAKAKGQPGKAARANPASCAGPGIFPPTRRAPIR